MRAAKFVPRKNWVITGSDDMQVRVFNYNTLERSHMFDAHSDYIRCIAIHPTQPFILTSSGEAPTPPSWGDSGLWWSWDCPGCPNGLLPHPAFGELNVWAGGQVSSSVEICVSCVGKAHNRCRFPMNLE